MGWSESIRGRALSAMRRPEGSNCHSALASAGPIEITALGASNKAGYGVGVEHAYPAALERLLRALGHDVVVHNAGISGNTTAQMLARLDTAVPPATRLVLFQPGSNDARLGISEAVREANVMTISQIFHARGIRLVRVAAAFEAARRENHFQDDGIHHTAVGHECIAAALLPDVLAALGMTGIEGDPS